MGASPVRLVLLSLAHRLHVVKRLRARVQFSHGARGRLHSFQPSAFRPMSEQRRESGAHQRRVQWVGQPILEVALAQLQDVLEELVLLGRRPHGPPSRPNLALRLSRVLGLGVPDHVDEKPAPLLLEVRPCARVSPQARRDKGLRCTAHSLEDALVVERQALLGPGHVEERRVRKEEGEAQSAADGRSSRRAVRIVSSEGQGLRTYVRRPGQVLKSRDGREDSTLRSQGPRVRSQDLGGEARGEHKQGAS